MDELDEYLKDPVAWVNKQTEDFERRKYDLEQWYHDKLFDIYEQYEIQLQKANEWAKIHQKEYLVKQV